MVTMNPLRHLIDDQLTSAPSLGDQRHDKPDGSEVAPLVAAQLEELETELLVLADRLEHLQGELSSAIREARREPVRAAA